MLSKLVISTYLLVSSAGASALAKPNPEAIPNNIVARQTSAAGSSCTFGPAYSSLLVSKPTVPADLAAAAASFAASATNICDGPKFTGTVSAEWVTYSSAEIAWASSNSAAISSVVKSLQSACPGVSNVADAFSGLGALCTTKATAAPSATSASSATVPSVSAGSTKNGAAAPMQTMMAAGVAMAAGAMGILAL